MNTADLASVQRGCGLLVLGVCVVLAGIVAWAVVS